MTLAAAYCRLLFKLFEGEIIKDFSYDGLDSRLTGFSVRGWGNLGRGREGRGEEWAMIREGGRGMGYSPGYVAGSGGGEIWEGPRMRGLSTRVLTFILICSALLRVSGDARLGFTGVDTFSC